jgi:hypothetical protein
VLRAKLSQQKTVIDGAEIGTPIAQVEVEAEAVAGVAEGSTTSTKGEEAAVIMVIHLLITHNTCTLLALRVLLTVCNEGCSMIKTVSTKRWCSQNEHTTYTKSYYIVRAMYTYPVSRQLISSFISPSPISKSTILKPLHLPCGPIQPPHPALHKLLIPRPHNPLRKLHIIERTQPQYPLPGKPLANAIHQRATRVAEVIRHLHAALDALDGAVRLEVVLSPDVRQVRVVDRKV